MQAVPHLVNPPHTGCKLIIDWTGPEQWVWTFDEVVHCHSEPRMQTGEADIKFIQWAMRYYGTGFAAEAVDGDFIPIALISNIPMLCILRLECGGESNTRSYEWVDVDRVRVGMRQEMRQFTSEPGPAGWEMRCLICLIALTGTDFSRTLPTVGPKKVWFLMPSFIRGMMTCFNDETLEPTMALQKIVAPIYRSIYNKYTAMATSYEDVMLAISNSKLSPTTKTRMPLVNQCLTTIRNANFLIKYWAAKSPDCMCGHGFRVNNREVEWDD